jgi:hypothetical protein
MKTLVNRAYPNENIDMVYWSKKWGVSTTQINDAILYTGSLNPTRLKTYLKRDNWLHIAYYWINNLFGVSNKPLQ